LTPVKARQDCGSRGFLMQPRDGVFLEDLCPKLRDRSWRRSLHALTKGSCLYCGAPSESIDHVLPRSQGGCSTTENCVPACLACNGQKGDNDAFAWYREQDFYDPRRAMALRAWLEGDMHMALKLLSWSHPAEQASPRNNTTVRPEPVRAGSSSGDGQAGAPRRRTSKAGSNYQTRQAATPLWRWQIAS
jgi:hypothetical protein